MKKLLVSLLLVASVVAVAYAAYTTFTDVRVTHDLIVGNNATVGGTFGVTGKVSLPYAVLTSTYNVSVTTPSYVGQLALNGSYVLYVASGIANPTQWIKVGGQ